MKRKTAQRRAIQTVLHQARRPLTPADILEAARRHCPGLGLATVYRTLRSLTDRGAVLPVEIPGSPPLYESAERSHHHHFLCRACGQVYEVEGCLENLVGTLTPPGFLLEDHDMTLYGHCAACADDP